MLLDAELREILKEMDTLDCGRRNILSIFAKQQRTAEYTSEAQRSTDCLLKPLG